MRTGARAAVHACDWVLARIGRIQAAFAVVLRLTGIAILTCGDNWLEAQVVRWLPDAWVNLTTAI